MSGLDYFKSSLHADSSALGSFSSNLKEKCEEAGGEEDVFKQIKLDICRVEVQGSDVFNEEPLLRCPMSFSTLVVKMVRREMRGAVMRKKFVIICKHK